MNRRFFLLAAPAIIAAPSLMRVSAAHVPVVPWNVDAEWINGRLVSHKEIVEAGDIISGDLATIRYDGIHWALEPAGRT